MSNRINSLQQKLKEQNLDALFVSNQSNVSYLTGFIGLAPSEREGFLFVTINHAYLLTFPTYYGMYKTGGDAFESRCITPDKRISDHLRDIIHKEDLKLIGCEPTNLTLSEHNSLQQKLNISFCETALLVESLRIMKEQSEVVSIRKAAMLTDQAFEFIQTKIKRSVSERELAFELEFFFKKKGADIAFSPIVAFDKNAAIPHYIPSHNSKLTCLAGRQATHNLILLDFGAKVDGYCADMTRVVFYGSPNALNKKVYETVLHAQQKALDSIKPGVFCSEADQLAKKYITSCGFPEYLHGLGHGVGLEIHEAPRLKSDSNETLQESMVVTVEPGIYLEGECGVRIEDLVVLTQTGYEALSKSTKEITILT